MGGMRFTTLGVSIVVVAQGMLAGAAAGEPARYELDPAHTTIAFLVEHAGYARTLGQFLRASAEPSGVCPGSWPFTLPPPYVMPPYSMTGAPSM